MRISLTQQYAVHADRPSSVRHLPMKGAFTPAPFIFKAKAFVSRLFFIHLHMQNGNATNQTVGK
ncbi:hypothetical protein SAMN02745202_00758 [Segatella oulorum]|uniref:Uncharacterized protein n=1 Tax=Segatella oulorum TaxID=28136 RepID=A0A1T4MIB1_9BACT|nr:hypothetical protein SAMN02745202_00758 [Segatella oulorum]